MEGQYRIIITSPIGYEFVIARQGCGYTAILDSDKDLEPASFNIFEVKEYMETHKANLYRIEKIKEQ